MKIKYSSIIKFNITLLLLMQLSYTKLLGNLIPIFSTSYISNPLMIFYLSRGIVTILLSEFYSYLNGRMLFLEMLIMATVIIVALYNTSGKYNTTDFIYVIAFGLNYMYFFLAIPIYRMLRNDDTYFEKMLKTMAILCAGSFIIRAVISLIYVYTGTDILPAIALEGASIGWIRNGILRINPPCVGIIYLPIVFYLYIEAKKIRQRMLYIGMMVYDVYNTSKINDDISGMYIDLLIDAKEQAQ